MPYRFRPAVPCDREAVFAFCAATWPNGDYIPLVWDAWLADPGGAFVVGVDGEDSAVAVGKLSLAAPCPDEPARTSGEPITAGRWSAPAEGWLEGLRVAPALRGGGWGRALAAHLTDRAWALGMQTVRYLTAGENTPMHRVAAALGYAPRGEYHPHRAQAGVNGATRPADPAEAPALWESALAALAPAEPVRWRGWTGARATFAWFEAAVAERRVLVAADGRSLAVLTPPTPPNWNGPTLRNDVEIALLASAPAAWPELLAAARAWAATVGAQQVFGLLPAAAAATAQAVGWVSRTDRAMWMYERPRRAAAVVGQYVADGARTERAYL